jgi:hypothetical protein
MDYVSRFRCGTLLLTLAPIHLHVDKPPDGIHVEINLPAQVARHEHTHKECLTEPVGNWPYYHQETGAYRG